MPTAIIFDIEATDKDNPVLVEAAWVGLDSISLFTIGKEFHQRYNPGKPQQNAYVERFNRTVRYEWLAQQLFDSIEEVQEFATQWMWNYNHERPHMALGGITPYQRRAMAA